MEWVIQRDRAQRLAHPLESVPVEQLLDTKVEGGLVDWLVIEENAPGERRIAGNGDTDARGGRGLDVPAAFLKRAGGTDPGGAPDHFENLDAARKRTMVNGVVHRDAYRRSG